MFLHASENAHTYPYLLGRSYIKLDLIRVHMDKTVAVIPGTIIINSMNS